MFERIAGQAGKDNAGIGGHKAPEAAAEALVDNPMVTLRARLATAEADA